MKTAVVEAKRVRGFSRSFRRHFHEEYSIALVREGRSRADCPAGSRRVSSGNLVLIPEGVPHACNPDVRGAWSYLLLLIDPEWMLRVSRDAGTRNSLYSKEVGILPAPPDAAEVLEEAARAPSLPEGAARREAEDRLRALLLLAAGGYGTEVTEFLPPSQPRIPRSVDPRAIRIEEFLRSRCERGVTLREIAHIAGVGERAALRIFCSAYGLPPYAYLTNLRVNRAKELLRSGMPPSSAAQASGFYDQSHLTRAFSRYVGLPPARYASGCPR